MYYYAATLATLLSTILILLSFLNTAQLSFYSNNQSKFLFLLSPINPASYAGATVSPSTKPKIKQTPFDVYCKNNIFTPLGMTKTEWRLSNTPISELAIPYSPDITNANPHYTFPDYPNGGLRTNVLDLSKFLRMVIQNGTFAGIQILKQSSMAEMKTLQFGSSEQCLSFYYNTINGRKVLGHNGGEKGVTTEMYYDPNTNVGVIVFNNNDDADLDTIVSLLFSYGEKQ